MINRPSNPFQDIVANLFPELAGGPGDVANIPKRDPNGGPAFEPFQDGPPMGSFNGVMQGLNEQPGASRGMIGGPGEKLTRGQKLMPGGQFWDPDQGLYDTVPTFGEDRQTNDYMIVPPQGLPAPPDFGNPGQWEPAGMHMFGTGWNTLRLGTGSGLPPTSNDNLGGGRVPGSRAPANDNSPAPVPLFPASLKGGEGTNTLGGNPARDTFRRNVIGAESGGNPRAKNPLSSATGHGQFIKSTWNGIMKRHPELGLTANGRTDAAQSGRAIDALTDENEAYMRSKGVPPVTPGNYYAAHFLGAQGAVKALRSPDNKPMSSVVEPGVIAANGFLSRMTVGEFKAWTERKMSASRGQSHQSMPGAGTPDKPQQAPGGGPAKFEGGGGVGNYTAGLIPDEQQRRSGGGGGSAEFGSQQGEQSGGGVIQDDGSAFQPYLQEIAERRAMYKQRRADRRSRLEELLARSEQRDI